MLFAGLYYSANKHLDLARTIRLRIQTQDIPMSVEFCFILGSVQVIRRYSFNKLDDS